MLQCGRMKRGNKMFIKICEINNIEYLQKLIYTEKEFKTMQQYLHLLILHTKHEALSNHPKNKYQNLILSNIKIFYYNDTSCH